MWQDILYLENYKKVLQKNSNKKDKYQIKGSRKENSNEKDISSNTNVL